MQEAEAGPTAVGEDRPARIQLARLVLVAFIFTFITARVLVFLIMSRRIPDLFLHVGGTHIHHLNYGIFLLGAVAGYLILGRPSVRALPAAAIIYGIGLALTFDEFGMWVHLGGGYWQRASFDAIAIIAAALALLAFAPPLGRFQLKHHAITALLLIAMIAFAALLSDSFKYAARRVGPALENLERTAPP
jgi:hypothetical protein